MIPAVEIALLVVIAVCALLALSTVRSLAQVQVGTYKQLKRDRHEAERARLEVAKVVRVSQEMQENGQLLHRRVDELLADPGLKRVLSKRQLPEA